MGLLRKIFKRPRRHVFEGRDGCSLCAVTVDEVRIDGAGGRGIYAHIHRPLHPGRSGGIVFVPGGGSTGTDYDGDTEVTADEVAALGFTVLHYDPSGRGRTGGKEDFWGPLHQEELSRVVGFLARCDTVDTGDIGILSFSIGIAIAAGALARYDLPVRYLFDWEGPSNRFNITKNDTHKPLKDFPTSNDAFWREREPSRFIDAVPCGYFRYQGEEDHMQGRYKGHAIELLNLAAGGKAAWTKCNDNPVNAVYDRENSGRYRWVPRDADQKARILEYLLDIRKMRGSRQAPRRSDRAEK